MFFIVAFGLFALATAFVYALRPEERMRGFIESLNHATLFSVLAGTVADLATVFLFVGPAELPTDKRLQIVLEGLGECMSPGIMGFTLLSLTHLLLAVGRRRHAARVAA